MKDKAILLNHGSGGRLTQQLIDTIFGAYFSNSVLDKRNDSAVIQVGSSHIAFTTDSYVVQPYFFPGGDIGKLAVCGTVNDLAVSGAKPQSLSAGFIIEEGFLFADLERIVKTMANMAAESNVTIVTGDTKVVPHGHADGIFINTAGIGSILPERVPIGDGEQVREGDSIIINGPVGDHGMAIFAARENIPIQVNVQSDCAPLNGLIATVLDTCSGVKFMRDATRGGLGTVLCELAEKRNIGIEIDESGVPIRQTVRSMCEMFGFDPFFIANEGKVVIVADSQNAPAILDAMKNHPLGKESAIIGTVVSENPGMVTVDTIIGGRRILSVPAGDQLPRIC